MEVVRSFSLKIAFVAEVELFFITFGLLVVSCITTSFLCYHITLVWRNKTTNETNKWESLKHACDQVKKSSKHETLLKLFQKDNEKDPTVKIPKFGKDDFPINIYNNGVLKNFSEVIWPNSFVRKSLKAKLKSTSNR